MVEVHPPLCYLNSRIGLQAMENEIENNLVAAYSGLGTADGDQYYKGGECVGLY